MRNLAAAAQRAAGLPSNGVQGMVIERKALDELVQRLAALPASERASIPGVKPARADLILAGAVVVQGVLRAGGFEAWRPPRRGCARECSSSACWPARGFRPLFEDVRRASVLNLAARYHPDLTHTRHVAALALGHVRRARAARGARGRRARARTAVGGQHAARHRHGPRLRRPSQALALSDPQRRTAGVPPVEVAIIAQAARYHRKGMPEPGPLQALFGPDDAARLDRCAVLLRLAEDLERSRDQLVRGTSFTLTGAAPKKSPAATRARATAWPRGWARSSCA